MRYLIAVVWVLGCDDGGDAGDCREAALACASGFACVEQGAGWACARAGDGGPSGADGAMGGEPMDLGLDGSAALDASPADGALDAAPPSLIGAPCVGDDDCGAGLSCQPETAMGQFGGGACLRVGCSAAEPCPDGARCVALGDQDVCLKACEGRADCRDEYVCDDDRVCSPARCQRGQEVCDGADNDCDDAIDEANAGLLQSCGPRANSDARCSAGACRYDCRFGFLDRDGDPTTGCESPGLRYRAEGVVGFAVDQSSYFEGTRPEGGDPFVVEWTMDPGTLPAPDSDGRSFELASPPFEMRIEVGEHVLTSGQAGHMFVDTPDDLSRHHIQLGATVAREGGRAAGFDLYLIGVNAPLFETGHLITHPPAVAAFDRGSMLLTTDRDDIQFNRVEAGLDRILLRDYEGMACRVDDAEGICRRAPACTRGRAVADICAGEQIVCCVSRLPPGRPGQ